MLYNDNTTENAMVIIEGNRGGKAPNLDWGELQGESSLSDSNWCQSIWICRGLEDVIEVAGTKPRKEKEFDDPYFLTLSSVLQKCKI